MNRIITTSVADPSIQQPFTARSLDFLQDASKEMIKGFALSLIGKIYDPTKYYVVSGLKAYGTNQISEGCIFFNGELYYSAGKSTTTAFVNVPVLTLTVSDSPIDPVTFSDGTARKVHNVRHFVLSDAISGTGTVNYTSCIVIGGYQTFPLVTKAYNSSNVEVVGGFVPVSGYNHCQFNIFGNQANILIVGQAFHISAGVRKLTVGLPTELTSVPLSGCSVVSFQEGGTTVGFTGIATMYLGELVITNIALNTDFPTIATNGYMYLSITLCI